MSLLPTHSTSSKPPPAAPESPAFTITIRFTTSEPDLTIPIFSPQTTTCNALKLQIRAQRPSLSHRKLRLIHAGKVLPSTPPLSQLLPLPTRPPPQDPKGKGKARGAADDAPPCIWIHCSVGEPLSPAELATESSPLVPGASTSYDSVVVPPAQSTLPAPLGFDRLLTQGFSETEIAALRAQFGRLNPDIPADEMRALEDRWIDESVGGQGGDLGGAGVGETGMYEEMFWGTVIGFFWPVGIWLAREDGVFTARRRDALFAGILMNLAFGFVRMFA